MQVDKSEYVMTQKEVAEKLGIGRGMVNFIEKKAIEKVKKELERRGLDVKHLLED